jgi:hypothetical protein
MEGTTRNEQVAAHDKSRRGDDEDNRGVNAARMIAMFLINHRKVLCRCLRDTTNKPPGRSNRCAELRSKRSMIGYSPEDSR